MDSLIIKAILEHHLLAFTYEGGPRILEPHCFGLDAQGRKVLCGWLHGKGHRCFHLSRIDLLRLGDGKFSEPQEGHLQAGRNMVTILARC